MHAGGEQKERRRSDIRDLVGWLPPQLLSALHAVANRLDMEPFLVGGTVRDWLRQTTPHDLDLTVREGAIRFCRELIAELGEGALVVLGTDDEEGARVVWRGLDIDVSAFRGGAGTLDEDLRLRDFTINSMAVPLLAPAGSVRVIDPLGGRGDLASGVLRHCPRAFADDPLRLIRTFRFMADFGFSVAGSTLAAVRERAAAITGVAAERISYELDRIMASAGAWRAFTLMHRHGLLRPLIPELYLGEGVEQPAFHHLDVFDHNFQALGEMEKVLAAPAAYFSLLATEMEEALARPRTAVRLKWAALLHDVAKPAARGESVAEPGRVTFYNHDQLGGELVEVIGRRLRWSNDDRQQIAHLVVMHMHPFHLCNVRREQALTVRAALKLCRRAGDLLDMLFMLAMADSLAGQGEQKPERMEKELAELYGEVLAMRREKIRPALTGPPLLGGRDLIEQFALSPGPIFSVILDELQALQAEGEIHDRAEALAWVKRYLDGLADVENGAVGG